MKRLIICLLFPLAFYCCKNEKKPTPNNDTITPPVEKIALNFELDSINLKSAICQDSTNENCATADIRYLVATGKPDSAVQKINTALQQLVAHTIFPTDDSTAQKLSLKEAAENFIKDYESFLEEEDPQFRSYFATETNCKVLFESEDLICIAVENNSFTGGAHGNYFTELINFNKKTGSQIKADDLLKDRQKLSSILEKKAKAFYEVEEGQSLKDIGFYYETDDFPVNDNVGILQDSLIFEYNPYEVGPYVLGNMSLKIAKSEIQDFLK